MDWELKFGDTKNHDTLGTVSIQPTISKLSWFSGATGRTRTGDLLITNQLLYQLSHSSITGWTIHPFRVQNPGSRLAPQSSEQKELYHISLAASTSFFQKFESPPRLWLLFVMYRPASTKRYPFPGFFLEFTGNLQKSREKKRKIFSPNFSISSLAFSGFPASRQIPSSPLLYITPIYNFFYSELFTFSTGFSTVVFPFIFKDFLRFCKFFEIRQTEVPSAETSPVKST